MRSISWCYFQWPWTNSNPVFKVRSFFDAKYITNGYRYSYSYYRRRIWNLGWHHFQWYWVTSKPDFKVMVLILVFVQLTRDLFAIAKFLLVSVFGALWYVFCSVDFRFVSLLIFNEVRWTSQWQCADGLWTQCLALFYVKAAWTAADG